MRAYYDLAIEELAYAMGVMGGSDVASGFLLAVLGDRPKLELEGRLLAASHALVARGFLEFDASTGDKWLQNGLDALVRPLIEHHYSLRCSQASAGQEVVLNFYVSADGIVSHSLERAVVSRLQSIADLQEIEARCLQFFGFETEDDQTASARPLAEFEADLLDSLRQQERAAAARQLVGAGLGDALAADLATDLVEPDARGSLIRIDHEGGEAVSNRGFLVLKRASRVWLLRILATTPPTVQLFSGSAVQLRRLLQELHS